MKVYEIIESRPMFQNEINGEYAVIYEEAACRHYAYKAHTIAESKKQIKRKIYLYKGNEKSSLQRVMEYPVVGEYVLDDVLNKIKTTCPEAFM